MHTGLVPQGIENLEITFQATDQRALVIIFALGTIYEEFVEALRLLMTNARLRERLGENGLQYIRRHHRWEAVLGRFERLVMRLRGR